MSEEMDIGVLAESFAEMLGTEWPREKAVAWARTGGTFAADLWGQMAALSWPALTVPEAHGGLGLGSDAATALHAALGAAAAPVPMLGTTLATTLVREAGTPGQQAALLPGLADGSIRAAIAQPGDTPLVAGPGTVSGVVADLPDAPSATHLILRATSSGKTGWLILCADAPGATITRTLLADTTRTLGTVTLDNVAIPDGALLIPTNATVLDDLLLREACLAIAADSMGGGEAVLAATIDYMKGREQFGVLIASFQALKHRVADHQALLVAARGLVEHAASLATDDPEALVYAVSAKQHAAALAADVARDCIQLHGGVGFTAEYVPHIYLKRAKLNEVLFGTRAALLDRVADLLEAE